MSEEEERIWFAVAVVFVIVTAISSCARASGVLIGDSHACGDFGRELAKANGLRVECKVGSSAKHWVDNWPVVAPGERVVIALGTNSLLGPPDASYRALAQKAGADCVWIGPPHLRPSQAKGFPVARLTSMENNLDLFYLGLASAVKPPCRFVDSRRATSRQDTVDGVHRSRIEGERWARALSPL